MPSELTRGEDLSINKFPATDFIDRQKELAELNAPLDKALAGSGEIAIQIGEPGIGKRWTVQEFTALSQAKIARVIRRWCYDREGAPPYWPCSSHRWVDMAGIGADCRDTRLTAVVTERFSEENQPGCCSR